MNLKQKIALGMAGISLIAGSYFGGKTLYERGYGNGKQEVKQELTTAGNMILKNCEYDMERLRGFMYSGPMEEQKRFKEIYQHTLEKRSTVISLMCDVLDDYNLIVDQIQIDTRK